MTQGSDWGDEDFGIEMGKMRSYASHRIDEWRHAKESVATGATDVAYHGHFAAATSSSSTLTTTPGFGKGKKKTAKKR